MKNQALFSSKEKSKKNWKCRLLHFLFGALREWGGLSLMFGVLVAQPGWILFIAIKYG